MFTDKKKNVEVNAVRAFWERVRSLKPPLTRIGQAPEW